MTKKMKMDRKKKFDQLIAKRFENIREKIKQREIKRKTMRKSKRVQQAMNHGKIIFSTMRGIFRDQVCTSMTRTKIFLMLDSQLMLIITLSN